MAKSDDLVKYITQQVAVYIDTPKEVLRQKKMERKAKRKEPWTYRMFGMVPIAFRMLVKKKSK